MEITIQQIQQKFENLPEDLKWAMMETKVDDKVIEIGKAVGLNVAQMSQLSLETQMVMLGFTHPDRFEESLKGSLKLPDDKTRTVVNEINEKILKSIRTQLMALHGKTGEEKKEIVNNTIMQDAGIEITPEPPMSIKTETKEESASNREDMLKKVENPSLITQEKKLINSVVAQKLSGTFKMAGVSTEHSLNNISKAGGTTTHTAKTVDPYRLSPDE